MDTEIEECGHEFHHTYQDAGRILCTKDKGHGGTHTHYALLESPEGIEPPSTSFRVYEWNDRSETQPEEMGAAFAVDYDLGAEERQKVMNIAIADARHSLPKGTVFEIRAKLLPSDPRSLGGGYGRTRRTPREVAANWGIGWLHYPPQPEGFMSRTSYEPLFQSEVDDGEFNPLGGFVLLARIKA